MMRVLKMGAVMGVKGSFRVKMAVMGVKGS